VSVDIAAIVESARVAAAEGRKDSQVTGSERERLKHIAAEFESMLLVQMLRDMRKAGKWSDGDERDALGAESMFETIDVELASHLARAKGLGLQDQLLGAFDRMQPAEGTDVPDAAAADRKGPSRIEHSVEAARAFTARVTDSADAARTSAVREPVAPTTESAPVAATSATNFTDMHGSTAHNVRPVHGEVTSAFGWRRDPFTNKLKFHQGVDLRAAYGQEVQAAGAGTVVFSGDQGGYGTSVVVQHQDGTRTRYAHLSAALVRKGDQVGAGEPVGRAGRSGRATGTHLHFEVIGRDGRRVEPQQWARADVPGRTLPPGMDEHRPGRAGD
jgi:murein DD-endopeptidase MepM/ murein hydrolase activator NlpD